jgi:cyanophycinase
MPPLAGFASPSVKDLMRVLMTLLVSLALAPAPALAGKLYLMGGGYGDTNTDLFVNGLRKATGIDSATIPNLNSTANCGTDWATTRCPRIAVVTSAAAGSAVGLDAFQNDLLNTNGSVAKRGYYNLFQTHGFSPKFITAHVDNHATHSRSGTPEGNANIAILQQADVVFFAGGDQAKLARTWLLDDGSDSALAATLRTRWNGGAGNIVVAGDSAGNHLMNATMHGVGISYGYLHFGADLPSPTAVPNYLQFGDAREGTAALRYFDNGGTMKGLGLLPTTLLSDTHFDSRSGRLGRLAAAMRALGIRQGLGVDENTGVLVDPAASSAKVFGAGTLIVVDSHAATAQAASSYKVSNLRVSLLSSGDSYNFSSRTVSSARAAIGTRYYSGYYDSANVFAALETSKSLTRVVDQSASYNLGSAPRPTYTSGPQYPSTAPTLKVRFTRDASTKGYYGSSRYTVDKVRVDFE